VSILSNSSDGRKCADAPISLAPGSNPQVDGGSESNGRSRHARRRPRPWPLRRVVEACHSAPTIFVALSDMQAERRSRVVTPTRADLHDRTGLSLETISKALTALAAAAWIGREHVPVYTGNIQTATLLRITIFRSHFGNRRKTEKGGSTECSAVTRKKAVSGQCGRAEKSCSDSSYRRVRSPLAAVAAARAPHPTSAFCNPETPSIPESDLPTRPDPDIRFRLDLKTSQPFPTAIHNAKRRGDSAELYRLTTSLCDFPTAERLSIESRVIFLERDK
jgi:hypothetical protein